MADVLTIILATSAKSEMLAQRDPYGFIMTLTAVAVVFSALFILYIFFGILGDIISGKLKKKVSSKVKSTGKTPDADTAAAIAMALQEQNAGEIQAVIALALEEHFGQNVHDQESYIITINRK